MKPETSDFLYGYEAIALYLRLTPRQVKHLCTTANRPPVFKAGKRRVGASATSLNEWIKKLEGTANG